MGDTGHELSSKKPDYPHVSDKDGAKSGAVGAQSGANFAITDENLASSIACWSKLDIDTQVSLRLKAEALSAQLVAF